MLKKITTASSHLLDNVESLLTAGTDDDASPFKRRIKAEDVGISFRNFLPEPCLPAQWKRERILNRVETALSQMSIETNDDENDDENITTLLKSSTSGLLDSNFILKVNKAYPAGSSVSLEELATSDLLTHGECSSEKEVDLESLWMTLNDDDDVNNFDETNTGDLAGFVSSHEDIAQLKWEGIAHPVNTNSKSAESKSSSDELDKQDTNNSQNVSEAQNNYQAEIMNVSIETGVIQNHENTESSDAMLLKENALDQTNNSIVENCSGLAYQVSTRLSSTSTENQKAEIETSASKTEKTAGRMTVKHEQSEDDHNKERIASLKSDDTFYQGSEGFKYYKLFSRVERAIRIKRLERARERIMSEYQEKQSILDDLVDVAKAYYRNPVGPARKKWKALRKEINQHSKYSITDVRVRKAHVSQFSPVAFYVIIFLHVALLCTTIAINGFAKLDATSNRLLHENTRTFLGQETVDVWQEVNMWIGPVQAGLISLGALLSICMRDDHNQFMDVIGKNYSKDAILGCCEIAARNTAGTTTKQECEKLTLNLGQWRENVSCSERLPGFTYVQHSMRPCCVDYMGTCRLTSHEHCSFIGGFFYGHDKEHCSQVNCPSSICRMGGLSSDENKPWLSTSYQWWRPLLSPFLCHGVVHFVLLLAGEWAFLRQVEKSAGWLRTVIIYCICGSAGGMCASVFSPYKPQVSSSGGVMGLLGVVHMEILEAWSLLKKPRLALLKIYLILLLALFIGTFPHISNFAIVTGFLTGIVCAPAFLPYINLRIHGKHKQLLLVSVSIILLTFLFFIITYAFHHMQTLHTCSWCRTLECVSYAPNMCIDVDEHTEH